MGIRGQIKSEIHRKKLEFSDDNDIMNENSLESKFKEKLKHSFISNV